jgi:hypothetical protein
MRTTLVRLSIHSAALALLFGGAVASAQGLDPGEVLVGASRVNIAPQPNPLLGRIWELDETKCELGPGLDPLWVTNARLPWPENPNCIYRGGFGIGPMNALTSFDPQYGLWVRSVVISDGTDSAVLTLIDGTYYLGRYKNMCTRCGAFALAEDLGAELRIAPSGFVVSATHSHDSPDFIGGWGGVPQWYMDQVTDAIRQSVREAYASRRPARLEVGDELARNHNHERRNVYWSAEDPTLSWFRAIDRSGAVIATVAAYAAHPTNGPHEAQASADWHGRFAKRTETRFGGIALVFPGGLGNMSTDGGRDMGIALSNQLPDVGQGAPVPNPDVRSRQVFWNHPVTNSGLLGLGTPGLFDRPFDPTPASVSAGKGANNRCQSSSATSVRTAVNAIRVGNLTITGGPGELFSNLTNTIEERESARGQTAVPISIANDGLGYIMQSFEYDLFGGQVVGFLSEDVGYEDAYAIDRCFGDKVLEETLNLLNSGF